MTTSQPWILAFDTSTESLAMCLAGPDGLHTLLLPGAAQASVTLLPQAQALLKQAGGTLKQLDAVAFGRGPGAFTGLRTSCAVAQGLGWGLGLPLLPIDSLLIVAEDAWQQAAGLDGFEVDVAVDARMDEAYTARFRRVAGVWQVVQPPRLLALAALAERPPPEQPPAPWRAGSAWPLLAARGVGEPPGCQTVAEVDRAAALGRLALAAWASGAGVDAADALPVYLRDKVALTTAERAARVAR